MKKVVVSLLLVAFVLIGLASCQSRSCDAYKSSHYYQREILR